MKKLSFAFLVIFVFMVFCASQASAICVIKWWGSKSGFVATNETTRTTQAISEAYHAIFGGTCVFRDLILCYPDYGLGECGENIVSGGCVTGGGCGYKCSTNSFSYVLPDGTWTGGGSGNWDVICGDDSDNDGLPDGADNCPNASNPDQKDTDKDGIGDACDKCPKDSQNDIDSDGICGDVDNCFYVYNPDQADVDQNGKGDACDQNNLTQRILSIEQRLAAVEQALQNCDCTPPSTAIELSSLKAIPSNEKVILKWQTETETDNAGFNLWRAEGFQKMNESFIPALGSPVSGSEYNFVDEWVLNGKRYFYLLEDIDTKGISTFHGPVKAVPRMIYGVGK